MRSFDFARGFLRGRCDFHCGERADGANLIGLNFTDERDLRKNTDSNRGKFKFKSEKIS